MPKKKEKGKPVENVRFAELFLLSIAPVITWSTLGHRAFTGPNRIDWEQFAVLIFCSFLIGTFGELSLGSFRRGIPFDPWPAPNFQILNKRAAQIVIGIGFGFAYLVVTLFFPLLIYFKKA